MASAPLRRSSVLVLALLSAACFDPEIARNQTGDESTAGDTDVDPDTGSLASTNDPDATSPSTTLTTDESESDTLDSSSSVGPSECVDAVDCMRMANECESAACEDGSCVVTPLEIGAPCGDDTDVECNGADTCDGKGTCVDNVAQDGDICTGCTTGVCACADAACGDCTPAASNNFITTRAIEGWELTGGWALYREAPQSQLGPAIRFAGQVFGTDGNRGQPYPGGGEMEDSYARSGPTIIPATLDFLSWHFDEGGTGDYDRKSISISVDDGATWQLVADCTINPGLPFCVQVQDRAPEAWDPVSIAVPGELQGLLGRIELHYATGDGCCEWERGWFVDVTNFATQCACGSDDSCTAAGGECGDAVCGAAGECELDAVAAGTACGDDDTAQCTTADTCDGVGYCDAHDLPTGLTSCTDCPAGAGACTTCLEGACNDCAALVDPVGFDDSNAIAGWLSETTNGTGNDWRIYSAAPPTTTMGSVEVPFGQNVFGTDGNRVAPYDAAVAPFNAQSETSQVTTRVDTIPANITFSSWHVDEGNGVDTKTLQVSVDDGATWTVLLDCDDPAAQALYPFCLPFLGERTADAWDAISVDTGGFAGQVGRLRFTYDTGDGCCGTERGWFIDDLSFASYCLDPVFP